jgi:aspartyl protease family protein
MKYVPLIAVVAAVGLLGWHAPDRAGTSQAAAGQTAGPSEHANEARAARSTGWGIVLPREADGHFYAEVAVDGAPTRMLVDTGASVVALAGEDAEALGIAWAPEDVAPVAQGAGGPVHGVHVMLDSVQVGDLEVRQVQAIVVPDLRVSLLGQSFLSRAGRVEMTGDEMVLGG